MLGRIRYLPVLVALFTAATHTAFAQSLLPAQPVASDTVRGTVFDSLSGTPLVGAFVSADGSGASATTDSVGKFVLVSQTAVQRVVAYHELLDRVGIGALYAERGGTVGNWSPVLATPGMDVIWSRLCGGRRPQNGTGGIVFGRTVAADGTTRLGGAQVELQWELLEFRQDTIPRFQSRAVRSDSVGDYVVCGVQEFGQAGVIALTPTLRSAAVLLPGDIVPIRRANLILGPVGDSVHTSIRGIVQDTDGRPVADATVTIDGVEEAARTGEDGRFSIAGVPLGTRMLVARKIGLLPYLAPVDVLAQGIPALVVTVERGVTIEGVRITSRRTLSRDRREFDERMRTGLGKVMDSTMIAKYPLLQSALRAYPSLEIVTGRSGIDFTILGRVSAGGARCAASVYVDGVLEGADYLAVLPPANIAATELYASGNFAPIRFRPFMGSCAVLLVWTKSHLRR